MADVAYDCARLGIPRRFFICAMTARSASALMRKPMWIDARNPFMLDIMQSRLGADGQMRITEALPDRPVWPILAGQPYVTELHMEVAL